MCLRFDGDRLDGVCDDINASLYGLTLGVHSRIDETAEFIRERVRVGNIYVNRNQIGAVVEAQPFGGEGLSGTGPKAAGRIILRVRVERSFTVNSAASGGNAKFAHAGRTLSGCSLSNVTNPKFARSIAASGSEFRTRHTRIPQGLRFGIWGAGRVMAVTTELRKTIAPQGASDETKHAHVIVFGNEKGGTGKTPRRCTSRWRCCVWAIRSRRSIWTAASAPSRATSKTDGSLLRARAMSCRFPTYR